MISTRLIGFASFSPVDEAWKTIKQELYFPSDQVLG